jgi:hypothetical protein
METLTPEGVSYRFSGNKTGCEGRGEALPATGLFPIGFVGARVDSRSNGAVIKASATWTGESQSTGR